jgi:hypothetical protein
MQAHNGKNTASLGNKFTNVFVGRIIETPLRKYNRHATARTQKIKVAFNKQNITTYGSLIF